ncbi:unnamed protein product [Protopolystoma xenopodis]|uniref:Uncharacterized protein n=1 Tax=Protopolystoma xenopodis TaxID=117903 RepID=A0A448XI72_9PLAT|nr:unnamed protein product [Protopolystoma xenopodis]
MEILTNDAGETSGNGRVVSTLGGWAPIEGSALVSRLRNIVCCCGSHKMAVSTVPFGGHSSQWGEVVTRSPLTDTHETSSSPVGGVESGWLRKVEAVVQSGLDERTCKLNTASLEWFPSRSSLLRRPQTQGMDARLPAFCRLLPPALLVCGLFSRTAPGPIRAIGDTSTCRLDRLEACC